MLVVGAAPFQCRQAPSTKDVYPFVFGLRFGLHAVNTLKKHGFGRMGKGLQNLYSWVRFPPAPPTHPLCFHGKSIYINRLPYRTAVTGDDTRRH